MRIPARRALFLLAAAGMAFFLARGVIHMSPFGHYSGVYGLTLNRIAVPQRHVTDVVASVNFDYRGIDTIGEEFILFVSVTGVVLLLRMQREEAEQSEQSAEQAEQDEQPEQVAGQQVALPRWSPAVNALCQVLVAPTVVLGLYIISHGHLTPGGGFQGGAVLASAFLLLFLGGEYAALTALIPTEFASAADGFGAGGFVVIGFVGLALGGVFLYNALPLGPVGVIYSSGMIPLINLSVGAEVGAGYVLILLEFLRQSLRLYERQQAREAEQPEGA